VLRADDDFFLEFLRQVVEVVAVGGGTDDEVAVLLRVRLGFAERVGGHRAFADLVAPC